jgi:hypothetical protein
MVVVEKKENDQCTKEIHLENHKDEQRLIYHLCKKHKERNFC